MTSVHSMLRLKRELPSIQFQFHTLHKEKEMPDFRKSLLAFAALALLFALVAPANAQSPFTCTATSNPTNIRAEGLTELVGDILLTCTGGQPTVLGQTVPQTNFVIGLNTNITSRLLSGTGLTGGIDALLLVDEPRPTTPNPSTATPIQPNP